MDLFNDELRDYAIKLGVDLFGVADLTSAHDFILDQGGEYLAEYPRAVSFGIRLVDGIVDGLYRHEDPAVIFTYRGLYNAVNRKLDQISLLIAKRIQKANFNTYPIFNIMIDSKKLIGAFSHKLTAHLSGLGWIGKSCLLITPQYGPRLRWGTVLTDAPLNTGLPLPQRCGDCSECVDICPPKAFTGVPFNSSEPRDVRFRAHLCDEYMDRRKTRLGEGLCGLCVHICPHGKKKQKVNV
jgi:epoxyqueuosine reductase QueG